jgi:hypothetical protein
VRTAFITSTMVAVRISETSAYSDETTRRNGFHKYIRDNNNDVKSPISDLEFITSKLLT